MVLPRAILPFHSMTMKCLPQYFEECSIGGTMRWRRDATEGERMNSRCGCHKRTCGECDGLPLPRLGWRNSSILMRETKEENRSRVGYMEESPTAACTQEMLRLLGTSSFCFIAFTLKFLQDSSNLLFIFCFFCVQYCIKILKTMFYYSYCLSCESPLL